MVQGQSKIRKWVERNKTGPLTSTEWLNISFMPNKSLKTMTGEQALIYIGRLKTHQPQPL